MRVRGRSDDGQVVKWTSGECHVNLNLSLTLLDVKLVFGGDAGKLINPPSRLSTSTSNIEVHGTHLPVKISDIEWAQSGRCHAMAGRQWVIARCLGISQTNTGFKTGFGLSWVWCVSVNFISALSWFIMRYCTIKLLRSWEDKNIICFLYNNEPSLIPIKSI